MRDRHFERIGMNKHGGLFARHALNKNEKLNHIVRFIKLKP